jgi:hypothetical protein
MLGHEYSQLTRDLTEESLIVLLECVVRVDSQEFNVSPKGCDEVWQRSLEHPGWHVGSSDVRCRTIASQGLRLAE